MFACRYPSFDVTAVKDEMGPDKIYGAALLPSMSSPKHSTLGYSIMHTQVSSPMAGPLPSITYRVGAQNALEIIVIQPGRMLICASEYYLAHPVMKRYLKSLWTKLHNNSMH